MERRLAAILAIDMVGYSRLMGADESGTITRQKVHRETFIDPEIAHYGGRIVKTTGHCGLQSQHRLQIPLWESVAWCHEETFIDQKRAEVAM